jgi:aspartate/methionine/tyrosine aminotransferase
MIETPINYNIVKQKIAESGLSEVGKASIREIVKLINVIEIATGEKFIRMEMGVPGLSPSRIGTEAEIEALKNGVASVYPDIEGIPEIKIETSRFVKQFINIDIAPECCVPTTGSIQGSMAVFMVANRADKRKGATLFIDPGFPVHKQQSRLLNQKCRSFDAYNYRGDKLKDKLESYLKEGDISTLLYSNPNNPSWICFTEKELQIIGELATKYDVIVMEDLAYFAMDFRKDLGSPGKPPYQASVAHYTNNYIILLSSSKSFSYAGQRVGMLVISDQLFNRHFPDLKDYFSSDLLGHSLIYGALYGMSAGVTHSAQFGVAAMLKAANDGTFKFVNDIKEYGRRAKIMKNLFTDNGFNIVYDKDENEPVGDGFYFTISYPGFTGTQLIEEMLYYGISAVSLNITGSERTEGLRACVSQFKDEMAPVLEQRLKKFKEHHPMSFS